MISEKRRLYLIKKKREYRDKKRGGPPRQYITQTRAEEIFRAAGHCAYCGMLLSSEYHKLHPLAGCLKAAE